MAEDKKADFSVGEVGKEVGIMAGGIAIFELIRKAWGLMKMGSRGAAGEVLKHAGNAAAVKTAEKVSDKMTDKHRGKLLMFIQKMEASNKPEEKDSAKGIRARQEDRQFCRPLPYGGGNYRPGDENLLVDCLGKILMLGEKKEGQKKVSKEELLDFFVWLGKLPEQEFDAAIEFLNHDVVMQWIMMLGLRLNQIIGVIGSELKPMNTVWADWLDKHRANHGRKTAQYREEGGMPS